MAEWVVKHLATNGGLIAEFEPEALSFTFNLGKVGPHEISYELSLDNPALVHGASPTFVPAVGPYRVDFELWRDSQLMFGGMHTPVSQDGVEDDFIKLGGKSWLHYLQKRRFPSLSFVDWQKPVADGGRAGNSHNVQPGPAPRSWFGKDIGVIIKQMVEEMRDIDFYSLDFTTDIPLFNIFIGQYQIEVGDTEKIYDKLVALSNGFLERGFDFEMTNDRVLRVYPNEYDQTNGDGMTFNNNVWGTQANVKMPAYQAGGFVDLKFTNSGPEGTHAMGTGGFGSARQTINSHYEFNSQEFRRLDMEPEVFDVVDLIDADHALEYITSQVNAAVSFGANPVHEFELTLKPEEIPNFYVNAGSKLRFWPGRYLFILHDFGWHRVDSVQKITSIKVDVDNEGDELATVGLNQYYTINPEDGTPEP